MCFGGDDGSDEAKRARQAEARRQERIRIGTNRVNSIFDGGTYGTGQVDKKAVFDPNATYYDAEGKPLAGLSRRQFNDRRSWANGIFSGAATQTGFDDDFYTGRRQAYLDYATPQLEDQYGDAQKQLIFSLDRGGNLDSTARADKMSELQKLYDIQKQQVADKALSSETQARNAVEDARSNLISMLNVTGDAEGAASSALARSEALSAPAEYSPLSQLFVDFTNGLGTQAAQERAFNAGGPAPRYNTGLFGKAGRVSVSG